MTADQVIIKTKGAMGTKIVCPNNRSLDGQCVTYIKQVLAWCGVSSAWQARGNAKNYGDALVRDGLAAKLPMSEIRKGDILVNPNAPVGYGHIALYDGAGGVYESNYSLTRKLSHRGNIAGFAKAYRPLFYSDGAGNDNNNKKGAKMITMKVAGQNNYWVIGLNGKIQNIVRTLQQGEIDALKQAGAYFETTSEGLNIVLKANGWQG